MTENDKALVAELYDQADRRHGSIGALRSLEWKAADRIEELESWKAAEDAHHHMLRAENERLRGKVSQAILYFDDVAGLTENPLYNPLEVGFRHSPLSPKERGERYATACSAAWQSAQHGLAALGETQ